VSFSSDTCGFAYSPSSLVVPLPLDNDPQHRPHEVFPMNQPYPLRFHPVMRRYLWGGRRLESSLNKSLGSGNDWAESWEVCDLDNFQSVVIGGPCAGSTLHQLVMEQGEQLLGKHYPQAQFPLLLKFLDASHTLSVQVHPNNDYAGKLSPPAVGKSEAWVVLESAPGSQIIAGLKPGVDRKALTTAIEEKRCQEYLHSFHPQPGDCIFLPAGTVHALGEGILVIEIQQPSDVTYRLFDWNRLSSDGRPRPLHISQGLDVADFTNGPVIPQRPRATEREQVKRLVECDFFVMDRWTFDSPLSAGGDDRCHVLTVLEGSVEVPGDVAALPLEKGQTILLPAALPPTFLKPNGPSVLLDFYLP
jgi:mannose-6-phosphate isomerase